jgi:hypothetical protein
MKKVSLIFVLLVAVILTGNAQVYAHRQIAQHHRIHQGIHQNELTKREKLILNKQQKELKRMRNMAKADCRITMGEKALLHQKHNQISRNIHRFRNN